MEEVKKNIRTFLQILQIGKTESVIHWDESNFNRALKWAQYSEEVYKKLLNKPSHTASLSNYIKENHGQVHNVGSCICEFKDLQYSKEILQNILLRNPHLSSEQFSHVLHMHDVEFSRTCQQNVNKIIKDTYSIINYKGVFCTLSTMKEDLHSNQVKRINCPVEDICSNACAPLIWQKFGCIVRKKESLHEGDVINELQSFVSCSEKGIEVVMRLLVSLLEGKITADDETSAGIMRNIHEWILVCSRQDGKDNFRKIWKCPPTLLLQLSMLDGKFCQSYLNFLHICGDVLLGITHPDVIETATSERTSFKTMYERISDQIRSLLQQTSDHTATICREQIQFWFSSLDATIARNSKATQQDQELRRNLWRKIYRETSL